MKNILSALLVCLSFTTSAMDTVSVNTVQQLIDSIQSDRLILLQPGVYDVSSILQLSEVDIEANQQNVLLTKALFYSSGMGIVVKQVKNLTIQGTGETHELNELITTMENDFVLSFFGCSNIRLLNLTAQYDRTKEGSRKGGSWFINQCTGVKIERNLLARGNVGLKVSRSKNISMINSIISECSSGVVELQESWSIRFDNCKFNKNRACHAVWSMKRCTDVQIENSVFEENERKSSSRCNSGKMFSVSRCEMVVIKGNSIKSNDLQYLGDSETVRQITSKNVIKRNKFIAMVPPKDI